MGKVQLAEQKANVSYSIFNTSWGWMGIVTSEKGLRRVILPQFSYTATYNIIHTDFEFIGRKNSDASGIVQRLISYLGGQKIDYTETLDLPLATPFQKAVRQATYSIPYGETRSYSWVAQKAGFPKAARAVGQFMAHNPVPIVIPCHRVVASDGSLHGFRGGLQMKQRLILLEQNGGIRNDYVK